MLPARIHLVCSCTRVMLGEHHFNRAPSRDSFGARRTLKQTSFAQLVHENTIEERVHICVKQFSTIVAMRGCAVLARAARRHYTV